MVGRQGRSEAEISNAFKEVETYVADVAHTVAGEAIRRAKRSLLDSFAYAEQKESQEDVDG